MARALGSRGTGVDELVELVAGGLSLHRQVLRHFLAGATPKLFDEVVSRLEVDRDPQALVSIAAAAFARPRADVDVDPVVRAIAEGVVQNRVVGPPLIAELRAASPSWNLKACAPGAAGTRATIWACVISTGPIIRSALRGEPVAPLLAMPCIVKSAHRRLNGSSPQQGAGRHRGIHCATRSRPT